MNERVAERSNVALTLLEEKAAKKASIGANQIPSCFLNVKLVPFFETIRSTLMLLSLTSVIMNPFFSN